MEAAIKKPVVKKRVTGTAKVKETKPLVRDIMRNIEKWSVNKKIEIIKSGVSKSEFEKVKKETGLDYEILSRILGVTKATLHNKKGSAKFNLPVSEKLLMLSEIYVYGYEVFGDKGRFNHWLSNPIRSTGGIPPMDLLRSFYGMEEVKHIIGRIDYGVYS